MKLHDADPGKLLGDKGYDSDEIRDDLAKRGIEPVIPPRSNRNEQINYDRSAYKRRNLIERCVNRLKQFRRIATRYEKTARAYLSMLCIAATKLWIKPSTRPRQRNCVAFGHDEFSPRNSMSGSRVGR
jgi:transposase